VSARTKSRNLEHGDEPHERPATAPAMLCRCAAAQLAPESHDLSAGSVGGLGAAQAVYMASLRPRKFGLTPLAEAERKKQQSGMRRYFGSGGSGSKA